MLFGVNPVVKIRLFCYRPLRINIDRFVRVKCFVTSIVVIHGVATLLGGKRAIDDEVSGSLSATLREYGSIDARCSGSQHRPSISAGSVGRTLFPSFPATAREPSSEFIGT